MQFTHHLIWITLVLLLIIAFIEIYRPNILYEGFTSLVGVGDSAFWAKWIPRRGDVGPEPTEEQEGYIRDIRYFNGYTDVQRLGVNHDFCRMVVPVEEGKDPNPKDMFFACALGGTQGLSSINYRTQSVREGLEISRDDYMNDVLDEGRAGYCRIIKVGQGIFEAKCNPAGDDGFRRNMIIDANPPKEIKLLLSFYEGIVFWLRMRDDLIDYAKNLQIATAGQIEIEEFPPNPPRTQGLEFNGVDQFLRIGDTPDLSFGDIMQLRYLRAISFWVYFEEFTNNAHIIDFGNGAGKDNIFIGILGRGNAGGQTNIIRDLTCNSGANATVPTPPSGEQCTEEVSPQKLMETSSANVDIWNCPDPEIFGKIMPAIQPKKTAPHDAITADMIYEIWDEQQRKMHIQVKNMFPLRKWVHVAITASSSDAFKPSVQVYQNGKLVYTEESGWLPQTNYTTNNYIGKSNWMNVTSPYENADQYFCGRLFDLRGYRTAMSEKKVKDTVQWGKKLLGL